MAIGLQVNVKGAKELERKLDGLGKKYGRKVVRGAIRAGAKVILRRTKTAAPVGIGGKQRTRVSKGRSSQQHAAGYMRKSIVARVAKGNRAGTFAMLQFFDTRRFPDLVVRTRRTFNTFRTRRKGQRVLRAFKGGARKRSYFYPAAVEFGHRGAPPHPFVKPAFEQSKRPAASVILRKLRSGVERVAKERT